MPRTSQRIRIIQYLVAKTVWANSFQESSYIEDTGLINEETPEELLAFIYTKRYLEPRTPVPKSHEWCESVLPKYDDTRFRQIMRISRHAFAFILQSIKSHPTFTNNSQNNQRCVEQQLQIALFRFGRFGNAASIMEVSRAFGVSEGTVVNCTRRVINAILGLEDTYLRWYTTRESTDMKNRIYQKSGFSNCLGFLDGTAIVLAEKPVKDGEFYFNRKEEYGFNCQIIADLDARIRFFFLGYPASVHDARCIKESNLCGYPQDFFNNGEYILADSAYTLSNNILTPFKKPASLLADNAAFNKILSSVRVRVEHCIGILKNRFQSLKGMRQRVVGKKDARHVIQWAKACAILHNMVLEVDWWDERDAGDVVSAPRPITEMSHESIATAAHRELIMKQVLQYNYL